MAKIVDTPEGGALRANLRRKSNDPRSGLEVFAIHHRYNDLAIADMPSFAQQQGWFGDSNPPMVTIGCPKHGWVVVTSDLLREIDGEYRRTGKPVNRIIEHPPTG
jgi:hypothetical protein